MIHRIGIGLALTLALLLAVACDASDTKMERWAVKFTEPAIEVTAEQLYREFVQDDETAAQLYSGRRVLLNGTVFEVRDDDDFEPVVEFAVGQDEWTFEGLVAQFAESRRAEVEAWEIGDEVSMMCYIPIDEFGIVDFGIVDSFTMSVAQLRMCQPLSD